MNGEGQWLLLSATKTPTNHALDTKRRMWRLQMDATMPSLGQLGRYPILMRKSNPYQPFHNETADLASEAAERLAPPSTWIWHISSCFLYPIVAPVSMYLLYGYFWLHSGSGYYSGYAEMITSFIWAYIAPGFAGVVIGLLIGWIATRLLPLPSTANGIKRWLVVGVCVCLACVPAVHAFDAGSLLFEYVLSNSFHLLHLHFTCMILASAFSIARANLSRSPT